MSKVAVQRGLWRAPHLSLFLLAALWAGVAPTVFLVPGLVCDPVAWHRQEMMLGVIGAALGGYLLTALPHWVEGARVRPLQTKLLVLAWGLGRTAAGPCQPDFVSLAILCIYPLGLAAILTKPLISARAWLRLPIASAPLLLVLVAFQLRIESDNLGAVLGMALLVALVGGRIIPAFLQARAGHHGALRPALSVSARAADLALVLALVAQLGRLGPVVIGSAAIVAAVMQGQRMAGWPLVRGLRGGQADLAMLVVAWGWLPLGLCLLAASLWPDFGPPPTTALHALTMGLMGSMMLAVMARAWMTRQPGRLQPGAGLCLAFALLQVATVLRLCLPANLTPAALCWSFGWAIASASAIAALSRPVPHPVLSARRGNGARVSLET